MRLPESDDIRRYLTRSDHREKYGNSIFSRKHSRFINISDLKSQIESNSLNELSKPWIAIQLKKKVFSLFQLHSSFSSAQRIDQGLTWKCHFCSVLNEVIHSRFFSFKSSESSLLNVKIIFLSNSTQQH